MTVQIEPWAPEFIAPAVLQETSRRTVLLLGSSGAGKSTVMRQLLGTDPVSEAFPATSASRTTVAPTSVTCRSEGPYRAEIQFHSRQHVLVHVEENVLAACLAAAGSSSDAELANVLLTHTSLDFRFSYVVGAYRMPTAKREISREQLTKQAHIQAWIDDVRQLAEDVGLEPGSVSDDDALGDLDDDPAFREIVRSMMDCFTETSASLGDGHLVLDDGWPVSWVCEMQDRKSFMELLQHFTSNRQVLWGKLLSPLVSEVRVQGAFRPTWLETPVDLTIIDVEGLGQDAADSVGTAVTADHIRLMREADSVLLVDSAAAPHARDTREALEVLAVTGNVDKLYVLYTHVDQARDDAVAPGLEEVVDRTSLVVSNTLDAMYKGENLTPATISRLSQRLHDHAYYAAHLDRVLTPSDGTPPTDEQNLCLTSVESMRTLIHALATAPQQGPPAAVCPHVAWPRVAAALALAVADVTNSWVGYIGDEHSGGTTHWATVKAFTRRLGPFQDFKDLSKLNNLTTHWKHLAPVAMLQIALQTRFRVVLEGADVWEGGPTRGERVSALDLISREFSNDLQLILKRRLLQQPVLDWTSAYRDHAGAGSTRRRAAAIHRLLARATPMSASEDSLREEIRLSLENLSLSGSDPLLKVDDCP